MENRPAGKRSCVPEGNTPSKPREKRTRSASKTGVRKPLFPVNSPKSNILKVQTICS